MNTRKKITIIAAVVVLVLAVVLIWTGANRNKSVASEKPETQTSVEPTKALKNENTTKDKEVTSAKASPTEIPQTPTVAPTSDAVEGPDGDVILVPETQDGQSTSAKANNKSSANEDSAKSVSKEQNAGQQNKTNPDTTGQSVELPMVPGLD